MARPPKVPGKADNWQICLFCGNALLFGRHFLDSNSTYEAENFTEYSKFNSKNSFYYDRTPKNAWGGQKLQLSSDRLNLTSYAGVFFQRATN